MGYKHCSGWFHGVCAECFTRWNVGKAPESLEKGRKIDRCCLCRERSDKYATLYEDPTLVHPSKRQIDSIPTDIGRKYARRTR